MKGSDDLFQARGKDAQRGVAYHQRLLPAHTQLKTRFVDERISSQSTSSYTSRQPGQGGDADPQVRDLRAQLLEAEAAHYAKTNGSSTTASEVPPVITPASTKRKLEAGPGQDGEADEDIEAKRRRVLEETRDIDADSEGSEGESSDEER